MSAVSGHRLSASRLRLAVASLAVLLGAVLPAAAPPAVAASSTIAADSFTRAIATGWGAADTGGLYTYDPGNGAFSTDSGAGRITLNKAQANRAAYLTSPQARDVDMTVRVAYDKLPVGGGAWAYLAARRNGNNEYRPKLIINASGAVTVQAGVVVGGSESAVGSSAPTGLTPVVGSFIWLRAQITGASPTSIKVKAWADGTAEPTTWQFTGTNSNASLQAAGSVGVRSYVSSVTNAPIVASFDDLTVASLDAPPPPVASFTAAQETGTSTVEFSDTSTGAIDTWAWDFGDGATDTAQNPSHTYAGEGDYVVSLTVSGPFGSDSESVTVTVLPLSGAPTILLSDDFERPAGALWGAAPVGGVYSYQNRLADFTTDGTTGLVTLPSANATRSVFALSTVAGDVDISFAVSVDHPASGAATWIYAALRRTTDGFAYRPKIRLAPNGAVYAHAGKLTASGEKSLGPEVLVPGVTQAPNAVLRIHAQAIGTDPTTIRIRVWADGTAEPDTWQFSATDATPALQLPGALGVLAFANSGATNVPMTIHFDDLLATTASPVHRVDGVPFIGAGDIAACNSQGDEQTARLLNLMSGDVFTLGDDAYPNGSTTDFANCYDPSWGTVKSRTHPAVGNHEYNTSGAAPYYAYFGSAAGDPSKGYYAFDEGTWRIYVLNTNCGIVACQAGSNQEQWLRNDIAANPRECSLAITHHPRYSTGSEHGSNQFVQPLWQALYDNGVELLLSGHDHDYERFAPMNGSGVLDQALGVRQFVVGTGGANHDGLGPTPLPTTEVRQAASFGVLDLVLGDGEYEWDFIPVAGQLFSDRGSGTCH